MMFLFDLLCRQFFVVVLFVVGMVFFVGCVFGVVFGFVIQILQFWYLFFGGDGVMMLLMLDKVNSVQFVFCIWLIVFVWGMLYYMKFVMVGVGGCVFDVVIMYVICMVGWVLGGLFDFWDLDWLVEFGVDDFIFLMLIWEKGFVGENMYSVVFDVYFFVLMFNIDVCDVVGVFDFDGWLQEMNFFEEFFDQLCMVSGIVFGYVLFYGYFGDGVQMWWLFYGFYVQYGFVIEFLVGGIVVIDKDVVVEFFIFMQILLDGEIVVVQNDYGSVIVEFVIGKSGMLMIGVWELCMMQVVELFFDVMMILIFYGMLVVYVDLYFFVFLYQMNVDFVCCDLIYWFVVDMLKGLFDWVEVGYILVYLLVIEFFEYVDFIFQVYYVEVVQYVVYDLMVWFIGLGLNFQGEFGVVVQGVLFLGDDFVVVIDWFEEWVNILLCQFNLVDFEGMFGL